MNHEFSASETAEHMLGLQASMEVIDSLISDDLRTDESRDRMDRNVRHLEIMLGMGHIQQSGTDFAPYNAAIIAGKAWLAAS